MAPQNDNQTQANRGSFCRAADSRLSFPPVRLKGVLLPPINNNLMIKTLVAYSLLLLVLGTTVPASFVFSGMNPNNT